VNTGLISKIEPSTNPSQFQEPDIWSGVIDTDREDKMWFALAAITLAAAIG
jgi:hypothetical protein